MASGYTNDGASEIVWYTLALEEPYQAAAGDWLGAAFEHYGGANVQVGEAQYTYDQTAFVYGPFGAGSAYDWYYSNEVPMVRLNLDPNATTTVSVEDIAASQGFEVFPAFPNPANESTRMQFRMDKAAQVTFELRDVTGKLVQRQPLAFMPQYNFGVGNKSCRLITQSGVGETNPVLRLPGAR